MSYKLEITIRYRDESGEDRATVSERTKEELDEAVGRLLEAALGMLNKRTDLCARMALARAFLVADQALPDGDESEAAAVRAAKEFLGDE